MLLEERERRREREAQPQPREQAPVPLAGFEAALRAARAPVAIEQDWFGGINAGNPYVPPDTRNLTWMRNEGTPTNIRVSCVADSCQQASISNIRKT